MNRNVWLLAILQGLFLTNNVTFIAINGLVGLSLAPVGWLATLPVMAYVVGGAVCTGIVARTQRRWGRRGSFALGLLVALVACLACAAAATARDFWLLCAATAVAGYYAANANLYRFASAELAPEAKEKAVSIVMAGGLLGAVIGPNLAAHTRDLAAAPFAGAYLALGGVAVLALVLLAGIRFPAVPASTTAQAVGGRPMGDIARQPAFLVAALAGSLGFGVMNLLMASTPLAMQQCGLPFSDAALVLEWHVIGMFAPGFFTGHLIKRFGELPVMACGLVLNLACIAIALSGVDLHQFLAALFVLGVGWNFLFTGATTLSLGTWRPEEKDRAQGALNFCMFATLAVTSLASGVMVTTRGWTWLNVTALLPVLIVAAGLLWLRTARPATA